MTFQNADEVLKYLSDEGVKFVDVRFCDLPGVMQHFTVPVESFFLPQARAATFPWKSHALWFYTQMVRWGQVADTRENEAIAREPYRPDLYRSALKPLGVALPGAPVGLSKGVEAFGPQ